MAALGVAAVVALPRLKTRLELSQAKHPSLSGHARMARRIAGLLPYYEYDDAHFFGCDGAPVDIAMQRRTAFFRPRGAARQALRKKAAALSAEAAQHIPDLEFTGAYRVPFQFSRYVRAHLKGGSFVRSSYGVKVVDLDGNQFYDLTGSYGVNVFGYDFYKSCIDEGAARVRMLGPVLGSYHPAVDYNVRRLREISGLDQVSFHMSGTEAVMQAVRLARYHTRRSHLVRFCGAYHGWWGDVQPGVGNPVPARETYTLKDMDARSLRVLRRRRDIACVLVNPLQALHPNAGAPGDSSLVDSARRAHFDRARYTAWLQELREVCTERGIVLIFDEVFVGFRLAPGGAQEYFGVRADMVTYGKTLGGSGLPVRCRLRTRRSDEAFSRRPARRYLFRARHVQFPSVRDGGDAGVSRTPGNSPRARVLPQPRCAVERAGRTPESAPARSRRAGGNREPVVDLDRVLYAAVALQLDVPVLTARRGNCIELGGYGPPDLQPQLQ